MSNTFGQRLEQIRHRIAAAALRAGRDPAVIRLIGASKTVSPDVLRQAVDAGLTCFGENRIQEGKAKIGLLPSQCEWHFIGALQTNKVRDAVEFFSWIHSVDRPALIEELDKRTRARGKRVRVLIEVNLGGEASKSGASPKDAVNLAMMANACAQLEVVGLMTVAPYRENLEEVRPFFRQLRELREACEAETGLVLPELSMGMSGDFEVAVEEGATMVRIGSALFGARG
ncbi:MAG: YggS family pyridoxal phosphate-dependent enzyme [Candidatus Methylacidiphilales bacterium]